MSSDKPIPTKVTKLIGKIAGEHRVLLDRDDPVLVTASVFEETFREAVAELEDANKRMTEEIIASSAFQVESAKEVAERVVTGSGSWVADQIREAMAECEARLIEKIRAEAVIAATASRRAVLSSYISIAMAALVTISLLGGLFIILH